MNKIIRASILFFLPLCAVTAQSGRRNDPGRIVDRPAVPVTGSVHRKDIPNEYLEVNLAHGTVRLEASAGDKVEWDIAAGSESLPPNLVITGPVRVTYADGYPGTVGTTTWPDRFTLDIGPVVRPSLAKLQTDLRLRVPRTLKLLHVSVHGAGKVIVNGYDGELTVTVDSGDIVGSHLGGPAIMEARNGGVELSLGISPFQTGPISLLSHNGSIVLSLPPEPSVVLELNTNCGEIHSDLPMQNIKPSSNTGGGRVDPKYQGTDADCSLRPKSLPELPGVIHLRYWMSGRFGNGDLTIRAMALQGDIIVKKRGNE